MGWLKRRVERSVDPAKRQREVSGEAREEFFTLATSLIGRDAAESSPFDDEVRTALSSATRGNEAMALEGLARAIRDRQVPITLDELAGFGRCARHFGVTEDAWTFLGACVAR